MCRGRLSGHRGALEPGDEGRDAPELGQAHLVGGRVARKRGARIEHALGAIGCADGRRAEQTHEPLGDQLPIVHVLRGEGGERARDVHLRLVGAARDEKSKERVDAAQLGNRVLVALVVGRQSEDGRSALVLGLLRALTHQGA